MGKPTGFLEVPREAPPKRDRAERLHDVREFILPQPVEQTRRQAGRCMDCGIPFCHQGCPLGNPIPEFNELVFRDRWEEAFLALSSTNDFPEFTGRLCPAPCEAACVLALDGAPVAIEQVEKEIADRAFREGWVRPRPRQCGAGGRWRWWEAVRKAWRRRRGSTAPHRDRLRAGGGAGGLLRFRDPRLQAGEVAGGAPGGAARGGGGGVPLRRRGGTSLATRAARRARCAGAWPSVPGDRATWMSPGARWRRRLGDGFLPRPRIGTSRALRFRRPSRPPDGGGHPRRRGHRL
jgi:hypothetical protein